MARRAQSRPVGHSTLKLNSTRAKCGSNPARGVVPGLPAASASTMPRVYGEKSPARSTLIVNCEAGFAPWGARGP